MRKDYVRICQIALIAAAIELPQFRWQGATEAISIYR